MSKTVKTTIIAGVITVILGGIGIWIGGVNATQSDVVVLKSIAPRVEEYMRNTDQAIGSVDRRLSRIEGKLGIEPSK